MNKQLYLFIGLFLFSITFANAQFGNVKINVPGFKKSNVSEEEAGSGIKEALTVGIEKGVEKLSKPDGYFKDPVIKVLMPEEAKMVESKLRALGQDQLVDNAIESMNRAAEDAAEGAKDIFIVAIKALTVKDAINIVAGEKDAATQYLSRTTRPELTSKFQPVIQVSLDKVNATKHWETVFNAYNKIPLVKKVNPNLAEYVTEKALDGLFIQIAREEKNIRENPAARVSALLKKVFGS